MEFCAAYTCSAYTIYVTARNWFKKKSRLSQLANGLLKKEKKQGTRGQVSNWIQEHYADRVISQSVSELVTEGICISFHLIEAL